MNSENLNITSSEISSEEEADHQKEAQDDTAGTKRSYECTFCRRGFTNAQALGGHMNIHRKDRAKAKQVTPNSSSLPNKFTNDESVAFPFDSDQPIRHHSVLESRRNFDMYFHQSAPNLNVRNQPQPAPAPAHIASPYEFHNQRSWPMHLNQELRGANLSLRIGPSHVDDNSHQIRRGTQKENEVDLELRLGHDPY